MEYNNPLNASAVNQDFFNRLFPNATTDSREQPAADRKAEVTAQAFAGVTYERYELDYLNVRLIEQGITGENRKAASSRLSVEAVHLTYERLQVSAGAAPAGPPAGDAVARTYNFSLSRAEYEKLDVSIGKKLSQESVRDFLKRFTDELPDPGPATGTVAGGSAGEEEEGLSEGQQKQLGELELLLRTFTEQSDQEIRETIKSIAGAFRAARGGQPPAEVPAGAAASAKTVPADEPPAAVAAEATQFEETSVRVEVKLYESGKVEVREVQDPLVIDLDGDGIELTDADSGVQFDLTGDGMKERTGTVTGDDAFLAYDRNGNGGIDSGQELFGDQHGAENGFAELAKLDDDGDGRITAQDAVYGDLQLWTDRNVNGQSEADELRGLAEANIRAISLDYQTYDIKGAKNALSEAAAVEFADGRRHAAGDVNISYIA